MGERLSPAKEYDTGMPDFGKTLMPPNCTAWDLVLARTRYGVAPLLIRKF